MDFGQTPWDSLSREELLRVVQRFYSALNSSQSVLQLCKTNMPDGPFWHDGGSGGKALLKADEALAPYEDQQEAIYRAFFRYADDLLFNNPNIGFQWAVCTSCNAVFADGEPRVPPDCADCGHPTRPYTWDDITRDSRKDSSLWDHLTE
jgi:hypothetical protein